MNDFILKIDEKDISEGNFFACKFTNKEIKTRAFVNALAGKLVMNYLGQIGINTESVFNLHFVRKILEEFDIADVMLPNIHIDARVIYDENEIFIPKSHFEYEIIPDIYIVLKINKDFKEAEILGFFEPTAIDKSKENDEYYFVEKDKLSPIVDLRAFIEGCDRNTTEDVSEFELENIRNLMFDALDNDISDGDKKKLLKALVKSAKLRDNFIELENFETLSYSAINNSEIKIPDSDDNLVNFDNLSLDADGTFEENNPTEDVITFENTEIQAEDPENLENQENTDNSESPEIAQSEELFNFSNDEIDNEPNPDFINNENNEQETINFIDSTEDKIDLRNEEPVDNTNDNGSDLADAIGTAGTIALGTGAAAIGTCAVASEAIHLGEDIAVDTAQNIVENISDGIENIAENVIDNVSDTLSDNDIEPIKFDEEINNQPLYEPQEEPSLNIVEPLNENIETEAEIKIQQDESIEPTPAEEAINEADEIMDEMKGLLDENSNENLISDTGEIADITYNTDDNISESVEEIKLEEPEPINNEITEDIKLEEITQEDAPKNIEENIEILPEETLNDISNNYFSEFEQPAPSGFGNNLLNSLNEHENEDIDIEEIPDINSNFINEDAEEIPQIYNSNTEDTINFSNDDTFESDDILDGIDDTLEASGDNIFEFDDDENSFESEAEISDSYGDNSDYNFGDEQPSEYEPFNPIVHDNSPQTDDDKIIEMTSQNSQQIEQEGIINPFDDNEAEITEGDLNFEQNENQDEETLTVDNFDEINAEEFYGENSINNANDSQPNETQSESIIADIADTNFLSEATAESLGVLFDDEQQGNITEAINDEDMNTPEGENMLKTPGAALNLSNNGAFNKNVVIAAIGAVVILAAAGIGLFMKNKSASDVPSDVPQTPISEEPYEPDSQEPQNEDISANIPDITEAKANAVEMAQNETPSTDTTNTKVNTGEPLNVTNLTWQVPDYLSYSDEMRNYLTSAGKSIKLQLSSDLLLATEYAYSDRIKIAMKVSGSGGGVTQTLIEKSSGSKQIDDIVLQSVKSTLNVVKPPSREIKTPDFNLTITIYF